MGSPNASSSDLQLAAELSRRLARSGSAQSAPAPPAVPGKYIAFRASVPDAAPAPVSAHRAAEAEPESTPRAPTTVRTWDDMLRWCQEAAAAKSVFVMDAQGFVIAKEGSYSYEDAEAMGTQLMVALDRFDELDSFHKRAVSLSVGFRSFFLTGLRIPTESRDCFTVGIIRTDPLHPSSASAIADQVSARASQL